MYVVETLESMFFPLWKNIAEKLNNKSTSFPNLFTICCNTEGSHEKANFPGPLLIPWLVAREPFMAASCWNFLTHVKFLWSLIPTDSKSSFLPIMLTSINCFQPVSWWSTETHRTSVKFVFWSQLFIWDETVDGIVICLFVANFCVAFASIY